MAELTKARASANSAERIIDLTAIENEKKKMTLDVTKIREDFPILKRVINGKRLSYLDSASSSQRPQSVIDAMSSYYENNHANVHRGVYTLAEEATNAYEGARKKIAAFINAPDPAEVLFSKNVTEALNLLAQSWGRKNLSGGDVVVLSEMEHHANIVPWLMLKEELGIELRYLHITSEGTLDLNELDSSFEGAKLVSLAGVSNVLGTINPIIDLVTRAHDHGALIAFDFAQWVPHLTTDVQALGADFIAFTGHKMLGPTGVGVLWGRRELLEEMPPFLGGGDMILDVRLDGYTPNVLPWKFEAGTPPIAEAIGLGAAIDYLEALGMPAIRAHEKQLTAFALDRLKSELDGHIKIFGPENMEERSGVISFALDGVHPHDISQILDQHGVCVRAGHHCAKPLMRTLNEPSTARASFYVYNDNDDVEQLVQGLLHAVEFFG